MKYLALVTLAIQSVAGIDSFDYDTPMKSPNDLMFFGPTTDGQRSHVRSICGDKDNSVEAKCHVTSDPVVYQTSKAALRIQRNGFAHCTGWLVGDEGHVLTNWHCVSSQSEADELKFEAMAEGESCETSCTSSLSCPGTFIHSEPLTFIKTGGSIENDYTLLQLPQADRANAVAKYGFLKLRPSGPIRGERIYIPQHPRGYGKRIAMKDGDDDWAKVMRVNTGNFNGCGKGQVAYKADTQGGSSGSPVIAVSDNAVIAIHHCGGCSQFANSAVHMDVLMEGLDGLLPESAYGETLPTTWFNYFCDLVSGLLSKVNVHVG